MKLLTPLFYGKLIRRYKRFLADIELDNGEAIVAHCPNTGSMLQCREPGSRVIVSLRDNPKRKLKYTWEMIKIKNSWNCVNTLLPNKIVQEAIENDMIPELSGYSNLKPEAKYGENSRLDFFLSRPVSNDIAESCFVEVKNVTLTDDATRAVFPDSVTTRGHKHLKDLIEIVQKGSRGVMFYVVERGECESFSIAKDIDPEYNRLFNKALENGVEMLAYKVKIVESSEIFIEKRIPILIV